MTSVLLGLTVLSLIAVTILLLAVSELRRRLLGLEQLVLSDRSTRKPAIGPIEAFTTAGTDTFVLVSDDRCSTCHAMSQTFGQLAVAHGSPVRRFVILKPNGQAATQPNVDSLIDSHLVGQLSSAAVPEILHITEDGRPGARKLVGDDDELTTFITTFITTKTTARSVRSTVSAGGSAKGTHDGSER